MDANMEGEEPVPNGDAGHDDQPKGKVSRSVKTPLQKEALEAAYSINPLPSDEVRKALGDRLDLTAHQVQVWFSGRRRKDKLAMEKLQAKAGGAPLGGTPGSSPAPPSPQSQQPSARPPGGASSPSPAQQRNERLITDVNGTGEPHQAAPSQHAALPLQTAASLSEMQDEPALPEDIGVADEAELKELLAVARSQLPAELTTDDAPPLGYVFDAIPVATEAQGEKRKRIMIDNLEMEGNIGGHVNVMRNEWGAPKRLMSREEREARRWEDAQSRENAKLRVAQEREAKRMAEQADKEHRAAARKQESERRRQEKDMLKALAQQERQSTRSRHRDAHAGPRDDLDLEMDALLLKQQQSNPGAFLEGGAAPPPPERPPFPPPAVRMLPAFPPELGNDLGPEVLAIWSFLHFFSDILGLQPASVDEVLAAITLGERSRLLGELHVALLRLLQADMEEAHAAAGQGPGAPSLADKAFAQSAACLEEAWAWGFDVDVWRAHLNALTWPEVLREFAIAAGLGRKRPRPRKEARPKMGSEGEDVVANDGGGLKLACPARFQPGTMKAAAWQVLSEAGPAGLNVVEIAKRIQRQGLRDLRTAKSPEASVAAALSRDVVFGRPAPATYCLASFLNAVSMQNGGGEMGTSRGLEDSRPAAAAAGTPGAAGAKTEAPEDAATSRLANAAADALLAAKPGAVVKEETAAAVKQEDPGIAANGSLAPKPEPLNGQAGRPDDAGAAASAVGISPGQQAKQISGESAQGAAVEAEPSKAEAAGMQNGITAVKPEEGGKQAGEGNGQTGHESDEESDLEDEEEEHDDQALGEPWVAALETTEYGALPLAARLGMLGALVQLALEGPSARAALEGRLEEAARVRKAMAEDAKAEKKKYQAEAAERARRKAEQAKQALEAFQRMNNVQADPNAPSQVPLLPANPEAEHMEIEMDESVANAAAKQRQLERAETIRRAEETNAVRYEELGLDRRHNRYWQFGCGQPGSARIFVELQESQEFNIVCDAQSAAALREALERRGAREGQLSATLDRRLDAILQCMPASPLRMPELSEAEAASLSKQHQDWVFSIPTQAHVKAVSPGEAQSLARSDATAMVGRTAPQLAKLKGDLCRVERTLPRAALQESWKSERWRQAVEAAQAVEELRVLLGELELAVHAEYISTHFRQIPPSVPGAWVSPGRAELGAAALSDIAQDGEGAAVRAEPSEAAQRLAWLPATAAAVSLRLAAFDAAVTYVPGLPPARDTLQAYKYIQRPAAPMQRDTKGAGPRAHGTRVISGQPIGMGGRARPSTFPPFPQALLQGPPKPFTLPVEELEAAVARAAEHGEALEPSEVPASSDPGSGTPSLPRASRGATPVSRLGSKIQTKKKATKSNLRKEFDRMATSGGWDNEDDYSAEDMDIDPAGGASGAASGAEVEDSEDDAESNRPDDEDENLEISD